MNFTWGALFLGNLPLQFTLLGVSVDKLKLIIEVKSSQIS